MSTYTVHSGDTLAGIAAQFGVTLSALEAANPQISNPNLIYPGQVLTIPGGTPAPGGPSSIPLEQVWYTHYAGGGNIHTWIAQACAVLGALYNAYWDKGYETLCLRESSYNPNAINTSDGNANGPIVADGHPQNCSRGLAQCIPPTFAAYHAAGTSVSIYDPVANIAASMHYVRVRYGVSWDGANLQAQVQQADPSRPPHGY
jgi:spore coat assembly protein SafA